MRASCDYYKVDEGPCGSHTGMTNTGIREDASVPRVITHRGSIKLNYFCLLPEKTVGTVHKTPREKEERQCDVQL